ncbi:MAG: MoxR family ATPase [Erysipelotrichaceae bacterium]|nr:MoxR family ATPase [Erysipelotrichaceae bacterium]MBR2701735.1 MoxR family ATPase [Erysipelotrichaceae bacterium]MBR2745240.1 MoxR family ATPase [Erysipelotrichaceae bacterium]
MITVKEYTDRIVNNVNKVIIGKDEVIRQVVVCFLAKGHILLEDLPGTGKTMLLRAFARSVGGDFKRIQFTPDLLPSDLTGINFFNRKENEFVFRKGPVFSNVILADEINRATPRTQSALLEAMEEKQVTVDGNTYKLEEPFIVMGTQNPIESYGTFPLPEAQLDRFFMKLSMGYMTRGQEASILGRTDAKDLISELKQVVNKEETAEVLREINKVTVSEDVVNYIMDIVEATRKDPSLACGVSTRGTLALYKASQITAAMEGRDYVIPEDVKKEALGILSHRITVASGKHSDPVLIIERIISEVKVPLENI